MPGAVTKAAVPGLGRLEQRQEADRIVITQLPSKEPT